MQSIIRFFINSNIWVAFCVLGLAFSTEILLEATNLKISQFVFASTIFAYNFQRLVRLKKGQEHYYKDWLFKNIKAVYFLMLISATASAYLFFDFKSTTKIAILFSGALSILYPFGIRKIPFAKIFIISFVWSVSTMLLLVLENNIQMSKDTIYRFASLFLFIFSITIPFDIRDVEYDLYNVITIPSFFGIKKAKYIAVFALFMCGIIAFIQYFEMTLNLANLLALILLYILAVFFVQKSDKKKGERYFSFWVESLSIISYFLLLISELIF